MVYFEKQGKKELKWELSSDIGKYDNIYKMTFKLVNDEGSDIGEFYSLFELFKFLNKKQMWITFMYYFKNYSRPDMQ